MAAVRGGVDQVRPPAGAGEHVAAPEVAVEAGGRLRRPGELRQPRDRVLDRAGAARRERAATRRPRAAAARAGARRRTRASPRPSRRGARPCRAAARRAAPRAARRRRRARRRRAAWASPRPSASSPRAPSRPSSIHSSARKAGSAPGRTSRDRRPERGRIAHRQHLRHRETVRDLAEPAQAGRLGRVLARPSAGARLHERAGAAVELDQPGVVDVAARDAAGGRERAPDRAGGRLRDHSRPSARSTSSRPRHAASTRSSTCSKPSSPP